MMKQTKTFNQVASLRPCMAKDADFTRLSTEVGEAFVAGRCQHG